MRGGSGAFGDEERLNMKLLELNIKNFGKFQNKSIKLHDGLQLICGENEAGKSTIHTFIRAMLFGLERKRGRGSANDTFSRYEPWENGNYYAGDLRFECGGKCFCLRRNFDKYSKKALLVCETDGEEMSVEDGDLDMLLYGLAEASYENTLYIGQLRAPASHALAEELKNYAAGYYRTGDDEINLSCALESLALSKKTVDREIKQVLLEKEKKREAIEQEASYIWREIHYIDDKIEALREELKLRDMEKEEKPQEGEMENEWVKRRFTDALRPAKWRVHPIEILVIFGMIVLAFTLLPNPFNSFVTVVVALLGAIYIWNRMKIGRQGREAEAEEFLERSETEKELVSTDKLIWELEHLDGDRKEKQVEYDNLQELLQEQDELGGDYLKLDRRKGALLLAERRLEEVSRNMQRELTARLNRGASEIIKVITNGKYEMLTADENLHMGLLDQGKYVSMEQVSQGTLEQIYFALRMAAAKLLYEEEYPVILDDTFAFYDDARLEQTLRWLAGCGRQVILFSCQKREEEILRRNGIHYAKTIL